MKTYCLVIDDDPQEESFNYNVNRVLLREGIELEGLYVNPNSQQFYCSESNQYDLNKVIQKCDNLLKKYCVSIVVSDYKVLKGETTFSGIDILGAIAKKYPLVYRILYSGTIERAVKDYLNQLTLLDINNIDYLTLNDIVKQLSAIHEFNRGKRYDEKVIAYMRKPEMFLGQQFMAELKMYPEMRVRPEFRIYQNLSLETIAEKIEQKDIHSRKFQEFIVEQVMAYMLDNPIKEDE